VFSSINIDGNEYPSNDPNSILMLPIDAEYILSFSPNQFAEIFEDPLKNTG
jgi:hypothetical protein